MKLSLPQPKIRSIMLLVLSGLFLASCGSVKRASYYDDDGIYATETPPAPPRTRVVPKPEAKVADNEEQDGIYSDYFGQKADDIEDYMGEEEVFTDVDEYATEMVQDSLGAPQESDYYYDPNNTYRGYGGWGENAGGGGVAVGGGVNVSIGIGVGVGWGGWGWGPPYWGYYPPFWGPCCYYGGGYAYTSSYNRSRRGFYRNTTQNSDVVNRSNLGSAIRSEGRYRSNSGRSNIGNTNNNNLARTARSAGNTRAARSGSNARRGVSTDAIARNRAYRSSRSTRAQPRYGGANSRTTGSRAAVPRSTYRRGNVSADARSGRGTYRTSSPRQSTYSRSGYSRSGYSRPSGYSRGNSGYRGGNSRAAPRRSGYRSGGYSRPSSGYRSSGGFRSSGGGFRSSGGAMRSSGGRSGGGRGRQ